MFDNPSRISESRSLCLYVPGCNRAHPLITVNSVSAEPLLIQTVLFPHSCLGDRLCFAIISVHDVAGFLCTLRGHFYITPEHCRNSFLITILFCFFLAIIIGHIHLQRPRFCCGCRSCRTCLYTSKESPAKQSFQENGEAEIARTTGTEKAIGCSRFARWKLLYGAHPFVLIIPFFPRARQSLSTMTPVMPTGSGHWLPTIPPTADWPVKDIRMPGDLLERRESFSLICVWLDKTA